MGAPFDYKGPFLSEFEGINQGSQKIEPVYSPGKTKFLTTTKNSNAKVFKPRAFDNITYNAVVLKVHKHWTMNPLSYIPFVNPGTRYTVIARIPGLHSHLPDPFKFRNTDGLLELYPTFVGQLEEEPAVGSVIAVAFSDNNDKFMQYGNGKILHVINNSPINGLFKGENGSIVSPADSGGGSPYGNPDAPSLSRTACEFLDFNSQPYGPALPPSDGKKSRKEQSPQTVGSSYKNRKSNFVNMKEEEREAMLAVTEESGVLLLFDQPVGPNDLRFEAEDEWLGDLKVASMEPAFKKVRDIVFQDVLGVPDPLENAVQAAAERLEEDVAKSGIFDEQWKKALDRQNKDSTDLLADELAFAKPPPDCKSIKTVGDYNAAVNQFAENEEFADYPRWPVTVGGYDVDKKEPTAGLWKGQGGSQNLLGGITSLMQSKRTITAGGTTKTRNHNGIDIATVVGTPCLSILDGEIVFAQDTATDGGATVVIKHNANGRNIWSGYCHLSSILCKKGQKVKKGECIGLTGGAKGAWGSGRSSGPHLHFQISLKRRGGRFLANYLNPLIVFGTKINDLGWLQGGRRAMGRNT